MRQRPRVLAISFLACLAGCNASALSSPSVASRASGPSGSTDQTVGQYAMSVDLGSLGPECVHVPDQAKHRSYTAAITSRPDGSYLVSLSGGIFLSGLICTAAPSGLGCNQFRAARTDDSMQFDLVNDNDVGHGGHIVEQIPGTGWMELIGNATAPAINGTVAATGQGSLWFCSDNLTYPFPCWNSVGCAVNELRMTLTPR